MKYLCLVYLDAAHWNACSDQVCAEYVQRLGRQQPLSGGQLLHYSAQTWSPHAFQCAASR